MEAFVNDRLHGVPLPCGDATLGRAAFGDGNRQAVGIDILRDPYAEDVLRLLKARNLLLDHFLVKLTEIRHPKTGPASAGGFLFRTLMTRTGILLSSIGLATRAVYRAAG